MRSLLNRIASAVFLLALGSFCIFLILALLEPIYTTPLSEWIPLALTCVAIGTIITFMAAKPGDTGWTAKKFLAAWMERIFLVTAIAIVLILVLSFFGWNGGAPLDDMDEINPAELDFP